MRTIERSSAFKRDYKRESKGPHREALKNAFVEIIVALAQDQPLAEKHRDHALTGNWMGYRECHIKPDLLLIYKKSDTEILRLARLGSHSALCL